MTNSDGYAACRALWGDANDASDYRTFEQRVTSMLRSMNRAPSGGIAWQFTPHPFSLAPKKSSTRVIGKVAVQQRSAWSQMLGVPSTPTFAYTGDITKSRSKRVKRDDVTAAIELRHKQTKQSSTKRSKWRDR